MRPPGLLSCTAWCANCAIVYFSVAVWIITWLMLPSASALTVHVPRLHVQAAVGDVAGAQAAFTRMRAAGAWQMHHFSHVRLVNQLLDAYGSDVDAAWQWCVKSLHSGTFWPTAAGKAPACHCA